MTDHDDNLIFDRLADGELSLAERQELLSSLDDRTDGWRRCALALLEAQTWRSEFQSFVKDDALPTVVRVDATAPTSLPARPMKWLNSSMAMAASAFLAFGIGWNMNGPQELVNLTSHSVNSQASNNKIVAFDPEDSRDVVTLLVKDSQGQHQRVRLPLMDAGELGNDWAQLGPQVPAEVRAGLQNQGYDVHSKQRFAPLFFEQGKEVVPMVVPVNDTYVVPVNRPVY